MIKCNCPWVINPKHSFKLQRIMFGIYNEIQKMNQLIFFYNINEKVQRE